MTKLIKIIDLDVGRYPFKTKCAIYYRQVMVRYFREKYPDLFFWEYLNKIERFKRLLEYRGYYVQEMNVTRNWDKSVIRHQYPEIIPEDFS